MNPSYRIRLRSVSAAAEQAWNCEALASPVTAPRFELWTYPQPAVVLGYSQSLQEFGCEPLPVVKRMAGGGAVLVGPWMLSLSIVLPVGHALAAGGLIESYRWLGELIACELQGFGIAATALPPAALPPREQGLRWACFGGLSPWEVVAAGRKIAGLAQRRCRNGLLMAAGILVGNTDWPLLCQAAGRGDAEADQLERFTTSCAATLGRPLSQLDLATALGFALNSQLFPSGSMGRIRPSPPTGIARASLAQAMQPILESAPQADSGCM